MGLFMLESKNICLCSSALPEKIANRLGEEFTLIPLPPDRTVDEPVQHHPDMICAAVEKTVFFHRSYAESHPELMAEIAEKSGCRIVLTDSPRSKNYPEDIALNAAVLPSALVCLAPHTAPELLREAENTGRRVISVKQGYAACSSLVCTEAVLTSDRSIHRALTECGIDCSYISSDGIALPGYGCGFIGGSGGIFGEKLYLFGSDQTLTDRTALRSFADSHCLEIVCLSDDALTDYGGMKFL